MKAPGFNSKPKAIQNIEWFLFANKIKYKTEYQFDRLVDGTFIYGERRKFRFDLCLPDHKIAIEYEGIFEASRGSRGYSGKSGHLTAGGYTENCTKYNLAQIHGWVVLRYTASNYTEFYKDIKFLLPNVKFK